MNSYPSQSSIVASRPLHGRVITGVSKVSRAAGMLLAHWRESRARSREVRAVDAITLMNEHMLRDIGAHDRLISYAAARSDADHRRRVSIQLSTPFLVLALTATTALGAAAEAADSRLTSKASAETQLVGVFTGEYINEAPVYRLPPVVVIGTRKVERARLEREEQSARAQQTRVKAAVRNPA
jgi:hypothetical protein